MQTTRPMSRLLPALALAAIAACRPSVSTTPSAPAGPAIPERQAVQVPAEWRLPGARQATFARSAMVSSNTPEASQAGVEVLRQGGNAVDAAVAVGFALLVTHPEAGNIGGGGYMVIRMADGRVAALDYRETAPLSATRDMYLDASGNLTDQSLVGHRASGVPGAVAGLAEALAKYGSMPLEKVMAPAIRLAEQGVTVDSVLFRSLSGAHRLISRFAGGDAFYRNGQPPQPGERFVQPVLARTLRAIAAGGADAFYRGWIADSIVAEMRRGGGTITKEDLARYRAVWREPVRSTYRGYTLFTMPPSSSGGVTITQTLNILETFAPLPPYGTAAYTHLLGSAYQRAFIDRNAKLADPDFVSVPVAELTSKEYARKVAATIQPAAATPTPQLTGAMSEGSETTHYSVVDARGSAVGTTTTINGLYGSGVYIPGAGFFLNNEMDDFAAQPGKPNMFGLVQGEANAIAPGKRMLSAMSPTIVLDPAGQLLLVVGGRGGPRIITSTSQVILNVIEHRMSLADAMTAPRIHHQALPDTLRYERNGFRPEMLDSLRTIGHALGAGSATGVEAAVMRVRGGWEGMFDPRSHGGAVGY